MGRQECCARPRHASSAPDGHRQDSRAELVTMSLPACTTCMASHAPRPESQPPVPTAGRRPPEPSIEPAASRSKSSLFPAAWMSAMHRHAKGTMQLLFIEEVSSLGKLLDPIDYF